MPYRPQEFRQRAIGFSEDPVEFDNEVAAMLTQAAEQAEMIIRLRAWLDEPIGTAEQVAALLRDGLGLDAEMAETAGIVAVKAITDCREEARAVLDPPASPEGETTPS